MDTNAHEFGRLGGCREANPLPHVPNVLEVPAHGFGEWGAPITEQPKGSVYNLQGEACCGACAVQRGVELYDWSQRQNIDQYEDGEPPKAGKAVRQGGTFGLSLRFGILFATGLDRLVHGEKLARGAGGGEAEMELWTLDRWR